MNQPTRHMPTAGTQLMERPQPGLLSIVIPCYNEESIIEATHARICSIAPQLDMNVEVLYIDDGSHDSTLKKLKNLASEDSRIAVIEFSRNFGQQARAIQRALSSAYAFKSAAIAEKIVSIVSVARCRAMSCRICSATSSSG